MRVYLSPTLSPFLCSYMPFFLFVYASPILSHSFSSRPQTSAQTKDMPALLRWVSGGQPSIRWAVSAFPLTLTLAGRVGSLAQTPRPQHRLKRVPYPPSFLSLSPSPSPPPPVLLCIVWNRKCFFLVFVLPAHRGLALMRRAHSRRLTLSHLVCSPGWLTATPEWRAPVGIKARQPSPPRSCGQRSARFKIVPSPR